MDPLQIVLLVCMGLAAGFVAGLIGLGGGVIFAPVLLFYFQQAAGIDAAVVSKLTAGSSLFCTFVAALASAWYQYRTGALLPRVAWRVGLFSAGGVLLTTRFVTTQPWYDTQVFQGVFGVLLLAVAGRMLMSAQRRRTPEMPEQQKRRRTWPLLAATGTGAGAIASAAGVGGGIVLVPAYRRLLRLPMERAVGTSSGTIVLISLVGVVSYVVSGWNAIGLPATALGYVDLGHAALLAGPAVLSARAGVWVSHYVRTQVLRWGFATVALLLAGRLLYGALLP